MATSKSTGESKDKAAPKKKVAPKATAAKKAAPEVQARRQDDRQEGPSTAKKPPRRRPGPS